MVTWVFQVIGGTNFAIKNGVGKEWDEPQQNIKKIGWKASSWLMTAVSAMAMALLF
jgi:hypothetical protein